MEETRTKNSVRNIFFSMIYYIIQMVLTFIVRVLFLRVFIVDFLGVNQLFSNILTILSVVESGFGSAVIFALYKPVAENDETKVRQLVRLYKKYYTIIGIVVGCLGIVIIPFLPYLINNFYEIDLNLYVMFGIFLATSLMTYVTAHRRALFYTSQRNDIETKINIVGYFVTVGIQLLSILVFKNYYVYALAGFINVVVVNILIIYVTNKRYKRFILKPDTAIDKSESKKITQNVFALFYHKIGGVVLTATDSLILSAFVGVTIVGKYANYLLITTYLNTIMAMFIGSIKGSVGNSIATESVEQNHKLFSKLNMLYLLINSFATICFISLANPFISFFFGSEMLLSVGAVILIGINMFLYNLRQIVYVFKDCKGLFKENKYAPLIEATLNLVLSIILVRYLGLVGVVLGTIISCIMVPLWNEPYILNKHYFKKSTFKYLLKLIISVLLVFIVGVLAFFIIGLIPGGNVGFILLKFIICGLVVAALLLLAFCATKDFKESLGFVKNLFKGLKKK